jgi:hypothetical protein
MSAKERRTHPPQKPVINAIVMLAPDRGIPPPGYARPETAPPFLTAPTRGVRRYLAACGRADLAKLEHLFADDAVLEMTRTTSWYPGQATGVMFIAAHAIGRLGRLADAPPPCFRSAGAYYQGNDQAYHPFSIVVLAALAGAGPAAGRHARKSTPVRTDVTRTERRV